MRRLLVRSGLALAVVCSGASAASAVCGDTVVDVDEQCDDGDTLADDCCSSTCQFEAPNYTTPCDHGLEGVCWGNTRGVCDGEGVCRPHPNWNFGAIGKRFVLRDGVGVAGDSILYKLRSGRADCYDIEPAGDPSIDTAYAFCIWSTADIGLHFSYLDELIYENLVPFGAGWEPTPKGWAYRLRDSTGSLQVRAQRLVRFKASGAYAELPGPADATQYFASHVVFGLVNSSGYTTFLSSDGDRNTPQQFRAGGGSTCD